MINKVITRKVITLLLVVLMGLPSVMLAATNDFIIKTQVTNVDTAPPTTPTLLSAVPIADTQIDITWSVSTDDHLLDGYVLFRDAVAIATTTLTSFSDTGLSASTTYAYDVYAFDSSGNISTTSNSISTTTLATPVIPPAATSTPSTNSVTGTQVFKLLSINIISSTNSALFNWVTTLPSTYTLRWGRDDAYDAGYIVNDVYRKEHQTLITNLEPGTTYVYQLTGRTPAGREVQLKTGQFKTEDKTSATPENVRSLWADVNVEDVTLRWEQSNGEESSKVRIVRSYLGFPLDIYDGSVVYEGSSNSFFDKEALSKHTKQFYTVFVISADGSISSGAVVSAQKYISGEGNPDVTTTEEVLPIEKAEIPLEIPNFDFSISNILIYQGNKDFNFEDKKIDLVKNESFIISIPYEALPRHLKSIIVTLIDPANAKRSYSFLLRINKDRTAYEAIIAPIESMGNSRLQIEIFDFEREVIARYRKPVSFVAGGTVIGEVIFPDKIIKIMEPFLGTFSLIFLILALIFSLLYWRSKKGEDKS